MDKELLQALAYRIVIAYGVRRCQTERDVQNVLVGDGVIVSEAEAFSILQVVFAIRLQLEERAAGWQIAQGVEL